MNFQEEATVPTQAVALSEERPKPWLTPGPQKEAWKKQDNHIDYRELKASRPSGLRITISGPRQFRGA